MTLGNKYIFFGVLFVIFIFEGLGVEKGHEISQFLIIAFPFFLYSDLWINKVKLKLPEKITRLFIVFLVFSFISALFAVNKQRSFEYLLYYASLFMIFLYVYNHREELKKPLFIFTIFLSFTILGYSILINYLLPAGWEFLIPQRGYQYVYAFYKTHNPLGSLLLITLSLMLPHALVFRSWIYSLLFIFILPFFLLSYSRSSYLAISLIAMLLIFFYRRHNPVFSKKMFFITVSLAGLCLFLFFTTPAASKNIPIISGVNNFLENNFDLPYKTFVSGRDQYFQQAIKGIINKPLFGFGPGNYVYASFKYAKTYQLAAETATNIFLEIFAENGLTGGVVFFILIATIIRNGCRFLTEREDLWQGSFYVGFLTMFISFQTDYSQRYFSYFMFFIIFAAIFYKEDNHWQNGLFLKFSSLILFIFFQMILLSNIFIKINNYQIAFYFYPLNQEAGNRLLYRSPFYANLYGTLFPGDSYSLEQLGRYYEVKDDIGQAIDYYQKSYEAYPADQQHLLEKIKTIKSSLIP